MDKRKIRIVKDKPHNRPSTSSFTTKERIRVIANIIVDRLLEYQSKNLLPVKR